MENLSKTEQRQQPVFKARTLPTESQPPVTPAFYSNAKNKISMKKSIDLYGSTYLPFEDNF